MSIAASCPNNLQLSQLIDGDLPVEDSQRITDHVESCETCQNSLQVIASGEIPVQRLLQDVDALNPPSQSAYWKVISDVQTNGDQMETPNEGGASLAATTSPEQARVDRLAATQSINSDGLSFLSPSDDPAYIGQLHHFQIARVLGRGGMGIVLEAFDTHLQRNVAIKVLNPQLQDNDVARQRFCREGRAAAAISHEHVVAMHQVAKHTDDGITYLVMQMINGETLDKVLGRDVPLPPQEVARIGMQVAAGLSAAHARGMVHRDIKPANILIESETNRVKLTDFGLARSNDDVKLTQTGMVTGTPLYMSPEQAMGTTSDERSDLFSLGAVMYEMATGISPFAAPTAVGVMKRIMDETPAAPRKLNPQITRPLSDLIMSLMSKQPENRPESASEVARVLASIVTEYGPMSPLQVPSVASREVKKLSGEYCRSQRRWTNAAWLAAAASIALAASMFFMWRPDTGDSFPSVVLADNPGTVWSVDFSNDGKTLAAAVKDGSVRIWNIDEQKLLKSFNAHRGIVWTVAYHPDQPLVVTCGDDSTVKLWNSETFELVQAWNTPSSVRGVAFSPDGAHVLAGAREGTLHIYDIASGEEIATTTHSGSVLGVDYSPDGKHIASVGSDKVVRIFDTETLTERQTLAGHDGPIYGVKFAPKGPLLVSVGWNRNIRLWNVETGEQFHELTGSEGDVWGVSFCGSATVVVTGDQMGAARVWDVETGHPLATLRGHSSAVHNVSLDPTSHRIATSSRDGTIRVWDMNRFVPE